MQRSPLSLRGTRVRLAIFAAVALVLGACADSPTSSARQAPEGPSQSVMLAPLAVTACPSGYSGDYPNCVRDEETSDPWTGGGEPGTGGSGSGSTGTVGSTEEDGPLLALIVCLSGLGMSGWSVHDVYDQLKLTVQSQAEYERAKREYGAYLASNGAWGIEGPGTELAQRVAETKAAFEQNLHILADKRGVSYSVMGAAFGACVLAAVAPTP